MALSACNLLKRLARNRANATCSKCQETFANLDNIDIPRVLAVDQRHPECSCERVSVSEYSTGPLVETEVLLRLLVAPQHAKKGKPRAAALADAERNGLSTFREDQASDQEILQTAEALVARARVKN